jgi:phenylalanyl-tRNA synthetase alpha chain
LHRHEITVLNALKKNKKLDLQGLLDETKLGKDEAMWAVQNLEESGLVEVKKERKEQAVLTKEGESYVANGLPEHTLVSKLAKGPIEMGKLVGKEDQIGFMWAKKKGLVTIEKGAVELTSKGKEAAGKGLDEEKILGEISTGAYKKYSGTEQIFEFKKRGIIEIRSKEEVEEIGITQKGIRLEIGEANASEGIENVDRNLIKNRLYVGKGFKGYNVEAPVERKEVAMGHPLRRIMDELKEAYLGLGFREISGPIIGPSFWNFDYLMMPQDHPAREVQDTFFLSNPKTLPIGERNLINRIKEEHEKSWHIDWSEDVAVQAVPRTHTTTVTGRYMHDIVEDINKNPSKYELPIKIFTIGRNFRNENIDYKHLADFYQTDGIIIGKNLTLANLFDTLLRVYSSIGVKISFKPLYYPFVEPGVSVRIKQGKEWLELGGAGIIRREITGVERKKINVLAWGLGVERILLIKDRDISNIASLYGPSVGWLRDRKIR